LLCFSTSIRPSRASPSQGQELLVSNAFAMRGGENPIDMATDLELAYDGLLAPSPKAIFCFPPHEQSPKSSRRSLHFGWDDSVVVMNMLLDFGVHGSRNSQNASQDARDDR
jgi:hypothetical protein